jgi:NAD+ synthase
MPHKGQPLSKTFTIAVVQPNPLVGDIAGNAAKVIAGIKRAEAEKADLAVFSELVVSGYPPEDLVLKTAFLEEVDQAVAKIAKATKPGGPAALVGAPYFDGRNLYNVLYFLANGRIVARKHKHHLPNYGVFDEKRIFHEGGLPAPISWRGVKLGAMICEDMWFPDVSKALKKKGADILIAPHGSPYEDTKRDIRLAHARARVKETGLPLLFLNQVGGQDELVFDGTSFLLDGKGDVACQLPSFAEGFALCRLKKGRKWAAEPGPMARLPEGDEQLYSALVYGLREYVAKNRFNSVVIGLSGGIDSALTASLAVDALGPERVTTVMMPSPFTAKISLEGAKIVAANLGIEYSIIPITDVMKAYSSALASHFQGRAPDTTEENIQARIRGMVLMALSNKFGHMVLATGNKSEMSVGYSTLYGDLCGGFAVLKDVYKTKVYALARWRNGHVPVGGLGPGREIVPEMIFKRAPSAELKADQTDQDTLPPYPVLDAILHAFIEDDRSVDQVAAMGFDPKTVARVERMIYVAEYKRRQAPPGVKVTRRLFGRDRRYPITNAFRDTPGTPPMKRGRKL